MLLDRVDCTPSTTNSDDADTSPPRLPRLPTRLIEDTGARNSAAAVAALEADVALLTGLRVRRV
jgi:hypothetical protein